MDDNFYSKEYIYEPLKEYDTVLREMHNQNATKYFENLTLESEVNIETNRVTVKEIRTLEKLRDESSKKLGRWRGLKVLLIILSIAAVIASIYLISKLVLEPIIVGVALILLAIGFIILIVKKANPLIKALKAETEELERKIKVKYGEAWEQMAPLNALFKTEIATELFQKTLPLIKMDQFFDSRRLEYLIKKFGLYKDNNLDRSTLYVQSGEINGNPFFISDNLYHKLGTKEYTGSIVIHWTTTSTDSKGRMTTTHHTQTLTATVEKPYPYYSTEPFLVYGNEAAPDLSFSRTDSDAEHMTEKQIERHVKKEIKKLKRKTAKDPNAITIIGNYEFEVLWRAQNRDNEVQFRLLFTALAQQELLALMKDKKIGFGDDFNFVKSKMINVIYPEHLSKFDLTINPDYYHGYDYEEIKTRFINYQNNYFKHIYFTFAPILAIPLYQQQKPHEYIYSGLYDSYVSFYEHEQIANKMGESHFKHELSGTRNILKTSTVKSGNYCDYVTVTAYGYQVVPRVDYVTKLGGDGRLHTIPVHWEEYIPVEQATDIEVNVPKEEEKLTYRDKFAKMAENLRNRQVDKESIFELSTFLVLLKNKKEREEK
ncbi:MAG: MAG1210 family protein [Acholeplasmataceae bacterium]